MSAPTRDAARGGYVFLPGGAGYSLGARAAPGHRIERLQLPAPLALDAGFALIERHLAALGRPKAALLACELRSPAPLSPSGFQAFNSAYVGVLDSWGLLCDGDNPVARSNVCPTVAPPPAPALHAFSYTVPDAQAAAGDFFLSGVAESRPGATAPEQRIVAYRDSTPEGLRLKIRHVVATIGSRLQALGVAWRDVTALQAYTALEARALLDEALAPLGLSGERVAWQSCLPPVADLVFEIDCRRLGSDPAPR